MPREQQGAAAGAPPAAGMGGPESGAMGSQTTDASAAGNKPGGGLGTPIATPDPLSKYKWWILGGFGLLLAAAAAFLLRRPVGSPAAGAPEAATTPGLATPHRPCKAAPCAQGRTLCAGKRKGPGKIDEGEYIHVKAALETVLKRALQRQGS